MNYKDAEFEVEKKYKLWNER